MKHTYYTIGQAIKNNPDWKYLYNFQVGSETYWGSSINLLRVAVELCPDLKTNLDAGKNVICIGQIKDKAELRAIKYAFNLTRKGEKHD